MGEERIQQIGKFIWMHSRDNSFETTDDAYCIIKEKGKYCIYRMICKVSGLYGYTGFWYNDFRSAAEFVDTVLSEQISLF